MNSPLEAIDRFFRSTLRLSHLRTLASLSKLGQVRKVAEAFHVTQSAISKQLAEIEAGLGEPVVKRQGNTLVLTPIGQCLASRANDIFLQLDRTRLEISSLRQGFAGSVTIGSVTTLNSVLVPDAINLLKRRSPLVAISVKENTADRLLSMLVDNAIDIAVVRMWHPVVADGIDQQFLMHEPILIVTGSQHPLAAKISVNWSDTMAYPWVVPNSGSTAHGALEALLARHGLRIPVGQVESISLSLNLSLYTTSHFIGLLPKEFAIRQAAEGKIAILPLDSEDLLSETRAFWRSHEPEPTCLLMLDCLVEASQSKIKRDGGDGRGDPALGA